MCYIFLFLVALSCINWSSRRAGFDKSGSKVRRPVDKPIIYSMHWKTQSLFSGMMNIYQQWECIWGGGRDRKNILNKKQLKSERFIPEGTPKLFVNELNFGALIPSIVVDVERLNGDGSKQMAVKRFCNIETLIPEVDECFSIIIFGL